MILKFHPVILFAILSMVASQPIPNCFSSLDCTGPEVTVSDGTFLCEDESASRSLISPSSGFCVLLGKCYSSNDCSGNFQSRPSVLRPGPIDKFQSTVCSFSASSFQIANSVAPADCFPYGSCFTSLDCTGNRIVPSIFQTCNVELAARGAESFLVNGEVCDPRPGTQGLVTGDPHFRTHSGYGYDFHGECDLNLLCDPLFANGTGLDIQIRTTRFSFFSYVEMAALKIGEAVLEIDNKAVLKINGATQEEDSAAITSFAGYPISRTTLENKGGKVTHIVEIMLGASESIKFHVWDMFVGVFVNHNHDQEGKTSLFHGSLGMMGDFAKGQMLGRDGETVIADPVAFAAEWQVRNDGTDSILFAEARLPQHPQACFLPEYTERELVSDATRTAAEKACEHWGKGKAECIYDVIATGNLDIADAEVY